MNAPAKPIEQVLKYTWIQSPNTHAYRNHSWELRVNNWETLTVSSKNWSPYTVDFTTRWARQYSEIMAIGVSHGETFKDSQAAVYGVDKSVEIHQIARANCRLRNTEYHISTIQQLERQQFGGVIIDCANHTQSVLDYVLAYHSGGVLILHKMPSVLNSLKTGNRQLVVQHSTSDPSQRHYKLNAAYSLQTMVKTHSIAEII